MGNLLLDLRFAIRAILKHPGFTAIAVLTLALGIGANSAIFSVVNAVLLRPLPYPNPDRLVFVSGVTPSVRSTPVSAPTFVDYREQNKTLDSIAAFLAAGFTFTGNVDPEQVRGGAVSSDFFNVLAVHPALGRVFNEEDSKPGAANVAILNRSLWERRFASDPGIIGRSIEMNQKSYTVIGVLPSDFQFSLPGVFRPAELWVNYIPIRDNSARGNNFLKVIGRLKSGIALDQARVDMSAVSERITKQYQAQNFVGDVKLMSLHDMIVGDIRPMLLILFGTVAFVLLIACANVANLLLARASARQQEIAIRLALGAGRARLIRQLLTESILLALIGGAAGLVISGWSLDALSTLSGDNIPRVDGIRIDVKVLGFSVIVSIITGVLFGLIPALQTSRTDLNDSLKDAGRSAGNLGRSRTRSFLVVSEVALSLVLLVGAGLLMKSLLRLQQVDPGFHPENLFTMNINLPRFRYPKPEQQANFYKLLVDRVAILPGVQSVGAIDDLPLTPDRDSTTFTAEGQPAVLPQNLPLAQYRSVTPDYFKAMQIPLLKGRFFANQDSSDRQPVLIINDSLAEEIFPGEDPVGKRVKQGQMSSQTPWMTIVGVVGSVRDLQLESKPAPEMYLPYQQNTIPYMSLVIRANGNPSNLSAVIGEVIHGLDKGLPLSQPETMLSVMSESIQQRRFNTLLIGIFAALAFILAVIGIYGVVSYGVTQRTREIGIRLALGAQKKDILKIIIGQGMRPVLIGVAIGSIGALLLTRLLANFLYEVHSKDPQTFVLVSLLLTVVALLAAYIPALKTAKIDPAITLRYE